MPYSSEKQRRFMYSQHPSIAKKWDKEGKNYVKKGSYTKSAIAEARKMLHG